MSCDLVRLKGEARCSINSANAVGTRKNLKTQWNFVVFMI